MFRFRRLLSIVLALVALAGLQGCGDDPVAPDPTTRDVGVVLSSTDFGLTVFDVERPSESEVVGLGPDGSPVSLAVRGRFAAVPMGIVSALAVVDLRDGVLARTVSLPEGSGATGVAFVNDSVALVANPSLNTVVPVNVRAGTSGEEVEVGRYPQAVVVHDGRAFVVNAELESFTPAGPSTLTVLDASTLDVLDTIELSGENAAAAAVGPDGLLYVVQSGRFGVDDGALSVVDPATGSEVAFHEGFGGFPGSVAVGADGLVYVGGFDLGLLVWDSATEAFVRGLDDVVTPGGVASTSGVGIDAEGRVYALEPDCQDPSRAHRLNDALESELEIPVGICPIAIGFTKVEG